MRLDVLSIAMAALGILFVSGAGSAPCPSGPVNINVSTTNDLQNLVDSLQCTGEGVFNVTWVGSLQIDSPIEVSNGTSLTVTGHETSSSLQNSDTAASPDVNIFGNNGAVINGGGISGLFSVSNGSVLYLNKLVLAGGDAEKGGAVAVRSSSSLNVFGCALINNNATGGGAIYASGSEINIDGSTQFWNNTASFGGAIFSDDSDTRIEGDTSFSDNSADFGGVIYSGPNSAIYVDGYTSFVNSYAAFGGVIHSGANSTIYVDGDTSFVNNSAAFGGVILAELNSLIRIDGYASFSSNSASHGGVIFSYSNVSIGIYGHTFFDSNSASFGGVIVTHGECSIDIEGVTSFVNNTAGFGGVIDTDSGSTRINGDTSFIGNSASYGGAIDTNSGSIYIDGDTSFIGNSASYGGAISMFSSGSVMVNGSTSFVNNTAGYGGAMCAFMSSSIQIDGDTSFVNNSAPSGGAILATMSSSVNVYGDASFSSNAAEYGGAISADSSSKIDIDGDALFTNNSAIWSGGAIYGSESEISIRGNAYFEYNEADEGGAIGGEYSEITVAGSQDPAGSSSDVEVALLSLSDSSLPFAKSVVFSENTATSSGGALSIWEAGLLKINDTRFASNTAEFGGAVFIGSAQEVQAEFSGCVFEDNTAVDGGAVFLHTVTAGGGSFTASVFRGNLAELSGGAIFNTGYLIVADTDFVENAAGVRGLAVMNFGWDSMSNASFSGNMRYCPAGQCGYSAQTSSGESNDVCARCEADVDVDSISICVDVPPGTTAPSSGTTVSTLSLDKGYYRTSDTSLAILECYQEEACLGGSDAEHMCAAGYEGPYCAVCAQSYASGTAHRCLECRGRARRAMVGLAIALFVAALLVAAMLLLQPRRVLGGGDRSEQDLEVVRGIGGTKYAAVRSFLVKSIPFTSIKIVVTVWQIIYQVASITGSIYPDDYTEFVETLGPFNLDLGFILASFCTANINFYDRLLATTLMPPLVFMVLGCIYYIGRRCSNNSGTVVGAVSRQYQPTTLFIVFLLVVYSSISFTIFQTFACDTLDDGNDYLRADYSLTCSTPRHKAYEIYALAMIFLYPVGIPAVFSWWLGRNQRDLAKPDREALTHLQPMRGVWAAYRPSRFYFEVVECGRRAALAAIVVFCRPNSTTQIAVALSVPVVFVFLSESMYPFASRANMSLYRLGNGIILASLYVALILRVEMVEPGTTATSAFSGALIAANVLMIVVVVVQAIFLAKGSREETSTVSLAGTPVPHETAVHVEDVTPVPEENMGDDNNEGHKQYIAEPGTAVVDHVAKQL